MLRAHENLFSLKYFLEKNLIIICEKLTPVVEEAFQSGWASFSASVSIRAAYRVPNDEGYAEENIQ
jgi:hypothetical protein